MSISVVSHALLRFGQSKTFCGARCARACIATYARRCVCISGSSSRTKQTLDRGEHLKAANSFEGELLEGGELWNRESSGTECFCSHVRAGVQGMAYSSCLVARIARNCDACSGGFYASPIRVGLWCQLRSPVVEHLAPENLRVDRIVGGCAGLADLGGDLGRS